MEFKEIYRFYDGGSVKFQSKSAKFDENFADGIIAAAQILIDDSVKIHAEEVIQKWSYRKCERRF